MLFTGRKLAFILTGTRSRIHQVNWILLTSCGLDLTCQAVGWSEKEPGRDNSEDHSSHPSLAQHARGQSSLTQLIHFSSTKLHNTVAATLPATWLTTGPVFINSCSPGGGWCHVYVKESIQCTSIYMFNNTPLSSQKTSGPVFRPCFPL